MAPPRKKPAGKQPARKKPAKQSVEAQAIELLEGEVRNDIAALYPPEGRDKLDIFQKVRAAQVIFRAREVRKPPMEWSEISDALGIPLRTCQWLLAEMKRSDAVVENPYEVIDRLFQIYEATIESMAAREHEMSLNPSPAAGNAQIGAARTMLMAAESQIFLLSRMGRLPDQMDSAVSQEQLMAKVDKMIAALERNKASIPPEVIADIVESIRQGDQPVFEQRALNP